LAEKYGLNMLGCRHWKEWVLDGKKRQRSHLSVHSGARSLFEYALLALLTFYTPSACYY
jgi:hypothetical protein